MSHPRLPIAGALIAAILAAPIAVAQTSRTEPTPAGAPVNRIAKPSPYEGVSAPPASDIITTSSAPEPESSAAPAVTQAAPAAPNPDAGIAPAASSQEAMAKAPSLHSRPDDASNFDVTVDNPDAQIVTYVPGPANALPEGTVFRVRMLQEISAADTSPGTPFRAQLTQDLQRNGRVVIPVGSELRGKIVYTTAGRRVSGPSVIHLRPDEFILPDGTRYPLHAEAIDTRGSDTQATDEGNIAAKGHGTRTLVELAMGSGSGAILGAKVGGPAGAVVGTAVGAGIVTAHWLLTNRAADLPAESTVDFSLTDPMFLTPTRE